MSLLQDIQAAAVDGNTPITTLLRQCAVLAARLKNDELRDWVSKELNGYPRDGQVPPYRILPAPAVGHLAGPFGSGYKNITIPAALLPKNARKFAEEVSLQQPMAELQELASKGQDLTCPWSGNLVGHMQDKFGSGLVLYAGWQTLTAASVLGLIDTVRNRILEFALRLENEAPAAGDPGQPATLVAPATVTHLYQTIIYGNVTGNVTAAENAEIKSVIVLPNDIGSLKKALSEYGVPEGEVAALEGALVEDKKIGQGLGPKTTGWIEKVTTGVTSGGLKIGGGVTTTLIVKAILAYFGAG